MNRCTKNVGDEFCSGVTSRLLSQNAYNEIGQLQTKNLHSTGGAFFQSVGYAYNERGWLISSSAPMFAMQLYYNTGTSKQYNGNIAYQYYGTPGNLNKNYTYTYDNLNRLTGGVSSDSFNETGITYDVMGNITALNRYQGSSGLIDQLGYTYNSTNQVQSIADASGSNTGLVNGTTTYSYDANGNMASNANSSNATQNKSFTYNLLNLPMVATVSNGTATYTYDAAGEKLRKVSVINGVTTTTEYISGIQYKNTTTAVDFIQTEEGKAVNNSGSYDYNYYLGDNLGNTRVTFGTKTGAAVLYQQDDYYPFGLENNRSVSSPKNEYLYNGKELQEEFTEYDYSKRFYDLVVARWTTIDPKAEIDRRWSPYVYGFDNSIRFEDPDGQWPDWGQLLTGIGQVVGGYALAGVGVTGGIASSETVVGAVAGATLAAYGTQTATYGTVNIINSFRDDKAKKADVPGSIAEVAVKGIAKTLGVKEETGKKIGEAADIIISGKPKTLVDVANDLNSIKDIAGGSKVDKGSTVKPVSVENGVKKENSTEVYKHSEKKTAAEVKAIKDFIK
jgi:RHS repeat-associated protein